MNVQIDHQPFLHRLPSRQIVLSHGRQSSVGKIVTEKSIYALFPPTKPDHIPTIQIISILMPSLINPQPETFLDFKIHLELLMLKQQWWREGCSPVLSTGQLVYSQRMEACSATKLKLTQSTWAILPIFPDTNNYSWHLQGNQETRYKCLSPRKEIGKWISFYQILKQLLRSNWQEWF